VFGQIIEIELLAIATPTGILCFEESGILIGIPLRTSVLPVDETVVEVVVLYGFNIALVEGGQQPIVVSLLVVLLLSVGHIVGHIAIELFVLVDVVFEIISLIFLGPDGVGG
jgi:hypothetical protein